MSESLPMPTRGPAEVSEIDGGFEICVATALGHGNPCQTQHRMEFDFCIYPTDGKQYDEAAANMQLIAAAFNAAEACRVMGYDPIGCIQALPAALAALHRFVAWVDAGQPADWLNVVSNGDAALAAARTRRTTP